MFTATYCILTGINHNVNVPKPFLSRAGEGDPAEQGGEEGAESGPQGAVDTEIPADRSTSLSTSLRLVPLSLAGEEGLPSRPARR